MGCLGVLQAASTGGRGSPKESDFRASTVVLALLPAFGVGHVHLGQGLLPVGPLIAALVPQVLALQQLLLVGQYQLFVVAKVVAYLAAVVAAECLRQVTIWRRLAVLHWSDVVIGGETENFGFFAHPLRRIVIGILLLCTSGVVVLRGGIALGSA